MIILKIGGSILTEKDSAEPKVDYENLNRIAEEIRQSLYAEEISNDLIDGLVIVHGAGSFGHPPAKKYQIGEPFEMKDYFSKKIGFSEVQNEVKKLNSIICETLIEYGIPAVAMPPSAFIKSHKKRISDCNLELLKSYIDEGFVPVLFGDVVIDDVVKIAVISGDQILQYIAKFLKSDRIVLGTDVDGVYTADPRIISDAAKLDEISYDEMLELASLGSKVLHNRSVELAKKYHIPLVVRSSFNKVSGTVVKEDSKMEKMLVSGVAADKDITRISLLNIEDTPGKAFEVFSILGRNDISVDIILQSIGRDGTKDISFTVAKADADAAYEILQKYQDKIGMEKILLDDNVAKLSIVGAGMATHAGVASLMFEALYDARINISMISTSEIKISVLINKDDVDLGMKAIHQKFNLAALKSI